ncbi:MAG: enoyl-CoA hydratase/isomerase family protein [Alphaproteobacteria bacterium]|nr:enoyl-CoA hydratase/isomerase family protein [Alphaproteobacteria bacterium]
MASEVRVSKRSDHILEIALASPQTGNMLSAEMAVDVAAALTQIDAQTRAVHFTGDGPDFCAGRKASMPPAGTRMTAIDCRQLIADPVLDFYEILRNAPVPVVASIRGRAAGVGCALAALADVAIAAESSVFSVPEMNHDIAPTLVMTALAERVNRTTLARMVLTRDPISAAEAKEIGIIAMAVPDAKLESETARILAQLASNSPPVVRGIKAYLNTAMEMSFSARKQHAGLINGAVTAERFR